MRNRSVPASAATPLFTKELARGLLVLAVLALIAGGVLWLFGRFVWPAIINFFSALSSLDAAVVVALITGAVSVSTILINSVVKARTARNEYLRSHRERPYAQMISLFYDLQARSRMGEEVSQDELVEAFNSFTKELVLWGSPKAIRAWGEWRVAPIRGSLAPNDLLFGMEGVMVQLRKDMGQRGRLKTGDILRLTINDVDDNLPENGK